MKKIIKTCKVKLDIPQERKQDVLETFRQYNLALNFCINKAWKPGKKIINKSKLHKLVYYPLREKTDFMLILFVLLAIKLVMQLNFALLTGIIVKRLLNQPLNLFPQFNLIKEL